MIIKLVLVMTFGIMLVVFLARANSTRGKAWTKILGIGFSLLAILSVLFPENTNKLAHFVGVGRGADLLLYGLVVIFILYALNDYLKAQKQEELVHKLARRIAITEALQQTIHTRKKR